MTSARSSAPSTALSTTICFSLLCSRLGSIIDEQCFQRQTVRQDVVPDVISTDTEGIQLNRISIFDGHFDCLEVGVHCDVYTGDGSVHLGSILQFNRHRFVTKFHQKSTITIQTNRSEYSASFEVRYGTREASHCKIAESDYTSLLVKLTALASC